MLKLNEILSQVKQLRKEEQINLLERLVLLIKKKQNATNTTKLSTITGVGADIWANTDIDKYIESEREW